MMSLHDLLLGPFLNFAFMQRALAGALLLSASSAPIGLFLILRRMSLAGDAVAHGVLPGVAVGFIVSGLSLPAMSLGGVVAGMVVAALSATVSRLTPQREDTTLAALYLSALSIGVMLVSAQGARLDLLHILFGSALAVDDQVLALLTCCAVATLVVMRLILRSLTLESLDPGFSSAVGRSGAIAQVAFLFLVVGNLVAGFEALGTLTGVGLLILPAAASRFWFNSIGALMASSAAFAAVASVIGLLISFYVDVPSGPAIIAVAAAHWLLSVLLGRQGGLITRWTPALAPAL